MIGLLSRITVAFAGENLRVRLFGGKVGASTKSDGGFLSSPKDSPYHPPRAESFWRLLICRVIASAIIATTKPAGIWAIIISFDDRTETATTVIMLNQIFMSDMIL